MQTRYISGEVARAVLGTRGCVRRHRSGGLAQEVAHQRSTALTVCTPRPAHRSDFHPPDPLALSMKRSEMLMGVLLVLAYSL